jgi:hypothetical protein
MHTHSPKQDPQQWVQDHPKSGQEFDGEVHLKVTVGFGVAILVTSVLTMIGMWFLLSAFLEREDARQATTAPRVQQAPPPEPRLQVHPEADLRTILQEQNDHLASYGWLNQSQDRGHIAIETAMQLIAESRLPVRSRPRQWENPLLWRDPSLQPLHPGEAH